MKLKLKCLESRETLRIQVPSPCSLYELQQILAQSLSPPPPPRFSLRFSLNARDDLSPPSPDASLESLGISSGDLVYFSTNPLAFSPYPSVWELDGETSISRTRIQEFASNTSENLEVAADLGISRSNQETKVRELLQVQDPESNQTLISQGTHTQVQNSSNQQESRSEVMDIGGGDSGVKKFSELNFLRKVLRVKLGNHCVDHKLTVLAVHAVLLESGFIGFDLASKMPIDRFHQPDDWPYVIFPISLEYTLPKLLTSRNPGSNVIDFVVIKFQNLGSFINVYGFLVKGGSVHRVCLDESRFAPTLDSVWAHCDENDEEVLNLFKMMKDGLALPLLIDLCEKSGLALPACFMRLPSELKLKILESLPGKDLARVECVSSEMRYLASNNNDLWKQKVIAEFGGRILMQGMVNWRERFVSFWHQRKTRQAGRHRPLFLQNLNHLGRFHPMLYDDYTPYLLRPRLMMQNDVPNGNQGN